MSAINYIEARINLSMDNQIPFDPEVREYDLTVPTDCFAIKFHVDYDPAFRISITTDHDAGRYGFEQLDPGMGDYIAGTEVPYYEYYDGYIVRLDKRRSVFNEDLHQTIRITAGNEAFGSETYTIHVTRSAGKWVRSFFQRKEYYDPEFDLTMPYWLYVPTDYDPLKAYPVVMALHGTGEREEPMDAILEKMVMATCWAEDSEHGHNQCIVIAPQCIIRYDKDDNWTTVNQFLSKRTESPFYEMPQLRTAWKILEETKKQFNIDNHRLYITGTSSGGFGAYQMAMDHPGTFAAIVAVSCAPNPAMLGAIREVPIWIYHSDDDPMMQVSWCLDPLIPILNRTGNNYRLTRYPRGMVFWQSGHFAWEVCYHDPGMRDWVFEQHRL